MDRGYNHREKKDRVVMGFKKRAFSLKFYLCNLCKQHLGRGLKCDFQGGFKVTCVFMCKESVFKGDLCVLKQSVFNPIRTSHPGGVFTSDVR